MTKTVLYVLGAVFIILGLLGFVNKPLLGIFEVNTLLNLIHLASGILALIYAGMAEAQAKTFAVVLGIVYALVTILGFLLGGNVLGLFHVNLAHNLLHLVLAVVFLAVGLGKSTASNMGPAQQ
jgi:uncharacterized protein DUF4383